MQTTYIWNRFHLHCRKIITILVILGSFYSAKAQEEKMNNPEHDGKLYYFGIVIGGNAAQNKISHSKYFTDYDSVMNITPLWRPGMQVGISGNLRLTNHINLRTIPLFVFHEQAIRFNLNKDSVFDHKFESIVFSMPLEVKFKSDRQTNFRFYVVAGAKFDYDFNANARSKRPDEIIKFKPFDYGYNLGIGFEFYYPNFILAPEIKLSNGMGNVLLKNTGEPTNKAIDKFSTRMVYISFHIEG